MSANKAGRERREAPTQGSEQGSENLQGNYKQGDLIGQNLRRIYDDVASEPLPEQFSDLLKKMKSESKSNG